jgi:hypothetical protein
MEATISGGEDATFTRARVVLALFVATLALGIILSVAFDPEVQTIDAKELPTRSGDARSFLIADFFFIVLYALLSPIAIWRFGSALGSGRPPAWIMLAALLLVGAGIFDAIENSLLLSATGSVSEGRVDAAHAVAIPKTVLFVGGALLTLAIEYRAIRMLARR